MADWKARLERIMLLTGFAVLGLIASLGLRALIWGR